MVKNWYKLEICPSRLETLAPLLLTARLAHKVTVKYHTYALCTWTVFSHKTEIDSMKHTVYLMRSRKNKLEWYHSGFLSFLRRSLLLSPRPEIWRHQTISHTAMSWPGHLSRDWKLSGCYISNRCLKTYIVFVVSSISLNKLTHSVSLLPTRWLQDWSVPRRQEMGISSIE